MRVCVLVENTAGAPEMLSEHGLSLYIETGEHRILFDAGQSGAFAENAEKLGISIADVDIAVLSHGHYDHGGGMLRFIELNRVARIYANRRVFGGYYNAVGEYIGLVPELEASERFTLCGDGLVLDRAFRLCTCNGLKRRYEFGSFGLSEAGKNGERVSDKFLHEQYLVLQTGGGRIVFSGCSHKGVLNIVNWLRPDVLIGGFHFMKLDCASERDMEELCAATRELKRLGGKYYTCHCTGEEQYELLHREMGDRLGYIRAGDCIEI